MDLLDLVIAEFNLPEVVQGRKMISIEPRQDCIIRAMHSKSLICQFKSDYEEIFELHLHVCPWTNLANSGSFHISDTHASISL